jgi:hypothetical protein
MTIKEFMKFLDTERIIYTHENINGLDFVYAYGRPEKIIDPIDHKTVHVFTPYLRVSHFGEREDELYTRDCGICDWRSVAWILNRCKEFKLEGGN